MSDLDSPRSYWINVYVNGTSSSFRTQDEAEVAPYPKSRIGMIEVKLRDRRLDNVLVHKLDNSECNPGHTTHIVNDLDRRRDYMMQRKTPACSLQDVLSNLKKAKASAGATDVDSVLAERGKVHGDFDEPCRIAQGLKAVIRDGVNCKQDRLTDVQKEAIDMIAHKLARILSGDPNHVDHWVDIAGYAQLVAQRCSTS